MASPQLENGYLRIANEVWDHLMRAGLNGTQMAVVMAVIRKVWGFKGKERGDSISIGQLAQMTGRNASGIRAELAILVERKILTQVEPPTFKKPAKWKFNKDWEEWGECYSSSTGQKTSTVPAVCSHSATPLALAQCYSSSTTKDKEKDTLKKKECVGGLSPTARADEPEHKPDSSQGTYTLIHDFWNLQPNLTKHHVLSDKMKSAVRARIRDGWTAKQICGAIERYSRLKEAGRAPGYNKWGLLELVSRDGGQYIDKLLDPAFDGFGDAGNRAARSQTPKAYDAETNMRAAIVTTNLMLEGSGATEDEWRAALAQACSENGIEYSDELYRKAAQLWERLPAEKDAEDAAYAAEQAAKREAWEAEQKVGRGR